MKLVRDAKTLKVKAIASLKIGMATFNSYEEDGRITSVLLHLQHACEMLLKAVLVQNRSMVFDKRTGKSIGFEKCLRLCQSNHNLKPEEAGVMRTVDAMRDASQHWFVFVSEDLLYMHTRALISTFDDYLKRALDDDLHTHIPPSVLPVSTKPPGDFEFLIDREYKLVAELLQPGRRQRDEARARIRSLLAMEALTTDEVEISEMDINRIEKAIKAGSEIGKVFPRLITVSSETSGVPATFMTYPGSSEPILPTRRGRLSPGASAIRLDVAYLWSFGEITVPLHLWCALVRFAAWIEPALIAEWVRIMEGYAEGQGKRLDPGVVVRAMTWADPRRDVGFARRRALVLLDEHDLHCVWAGRKLTADRLDIDHCLPWAAWPCEDLWNLMPSSPPVNRHGKRYRLPFPDLLERSEDRLLSWWERAWVSNPGTAGRFTAEAQASLPVPAGRDDLGAVFTGLQARRFAIRADQQVAEWSPA